MLGHFSDFCCRLLTFVKMNIFSKFFRNTIKVSNNLDPDKGRHSVGPDLGLYCLQWLSEDNSKESVNSQCVTVCKSIKLCNYDFSKAYTCI